jgi:tetratricopeptide (TPR) repeat protein
LATEALALDGHSVQALRLMAGFNARSRQEYTENLRKAVAVGESSLGKKFFKENRGHFWGIIETRPYLRARFNLAHSFWKLDQIEAATEHLEAMLELNPNDNLGVRDLLIGCYLALRRLEGARRLLKEYEEDISALFARVLERYLASELPPAGRALRNARKTNK